MKGPWRYSASGFDSFLYLYISEKVSDARESTFVNVAFLWWYSTGIVWTVGLYLPYSELVVSYMGLLGIFANPFSKSETKFFGLLNTYRAR